MNRKVEAIRKFARGKPCQMRLGGVCTYEPAKSIWSHAPFGSAGKGMGMKSFDVCGAIACTACDAALDQPGANLVATRDEVVLAFMHAHFRSLVMLADADII